MSHGGGSYESSFEGEDRLVLTGKKIKRQREKCTESILGRFTLPEKKAWGWV
jgi:hypothetical protein